MTRTMQKGQPIILYEKFCGAFSKATRVPASPATFACLLSGSLTAGFHHGFHAKLGVEYFFAKSY